MVEPTSIYMILKKIADTAGYDLVVTRKPRGKGDPYEPVSLGSTYAPWLQDHEFNETWEVVKNYTLVDKHRCFGLWQLVAEAAKLRGAIVEVGTWRGGSGALIAKRAALVGIKDTVYMCDTFKGIVKAGKRDPFWKNGNLSDTSERTVMKVVRMLGLSNVKLLKGVFPDETGRQLAGRRFRLCHIDVDTYQSAKEAAEWLWPKLVIGGIMVFDDYGGASSSGVTAYVNERRGSKDVLFVHKLNGHAIIVKMSRGTQ